MNSLQLVWKNLSQQKGNTFLSILLTAFGIAILTVLYVSSDSIEKQLDNNSKDIDLVIGAKGSPLQLILSSLYHVDNPTGNIPLTEALEIANNPLIELAVPISLGDNYKGHRIIGTDNSYLELYGLTIREGKIWNKSFQAIVGSETASKHQLKIGDEIHGAHGLSAEGHVHDDHPFVVVGILEKSNSIVDNLILCNLESVWDVHGIHHEEHDHEEHADHAHDHEHDHGSQQTDEHHGHNHSDSVHNHETESHDHDEHTDHDHSHESATKDTLATTNENHEGHAHEEEVVSREEAIAGRNDVFIKSIGQDMVKDQGLEITALLVRYRSPAAISVIPKLVNQTTNMQAASPAIETTRLFSLIGVGIDSLEILAYVIMFIAGLSIFISLYNALKQRKYDLAIMRSMGASKNKLFTLVIVEGLVITLIGGILGLLLGHLALYFITQQTSQSADFIEVFNILPKEWILILFAILVGLIASVIPAFKAYNTNISTILNDK
ncbi:ABC transporter permease [Sphingobacterium hungaricum]